MFSPEIRFCVRYLLNHGVNALNFQEAVNELGPLDQKYRLMPVEDISSKEFFVELAGKLRELWPPGEKDGKYPWRDSVPNLARRLELLWTERNLGKKYTIEQCLSVARKYLAQFEEDAKYMMLLKYFIMKQEHIVKPNKHLTYVNKSVFADMLESITTMEEFDAVFESSNTLEQGELI